MGTGDRDRQESERMSKHEMRNRKQVCESIRDREKARKRSRETESMRECEGERGKEKTSE